MGNQQTSGKKHRAVASGDGSGDSVGEKLHSAAPVSDPVRPTIVDTRDDPELENDTLLSCLLAVTRHHRLAATRESLLTGLPVGAMGLTPDLLVRAAERANLSARLTKLRLNRIPSAVCPVILLLEEDTACVFFGCAEDGQAKVSYPDLVDEVVHEPLDGLLSRYTGMALLARPRFNLDDRVTPAPGPTQQSGHWFWTAMRGQLPVYRDVLLAAGLVNLFATALPLFTMNVYDRVVPNAAFETLWVLAAGMLIVLLSDLLLRSLRSYFVDLAGRRVDIDLSAQIMEQTLAMRLEHRPRSVGSFAVNLRSFETLRDFIASASVTSIIDLPFALLFFAVIAWIAWPVLVPVLLGIALLVGFALIMRPRLQRLTESAHQAGALRNATLIESLTGVETLKSMAAESVMQRKWEEATRFLAGITVRMRLTSASVTHATLWCQQAVSVCVIITGVYLIADGGLTMGGLIATTMLASRSVTPFGQIAGLITQYHNARIALTSLDDLFATPTEHHPDGAFLSRESFAGAIEFKNVSFAYPGAETPALRDVSFRIEAGERVAILGRIGSGKSTVQKLAMGLYQPVEGAVVIDGIDIRQLEPREYRRAIGFVPQDATLFHGTLRDNIVLAHSGLTDSALVTAVKRSGLEEFVNRHPKGFDMPISERGDSVSGGQRRCIALARALVYEPQILMLDEPTGSMDNSTEREVLAHLRDYVEQRTLLVVTHRNSVLPLVDRIIVLDNGRVVADGPRDSVVEALKQGRIGKAQ
ncbi:MAG: type I secretion system permease/ATPase [Pseudomonadota bacterium]